ncbi:MAG: DUF1385 domain-containing protein, partial [Chloroflexia bacterium]
MVAKFYYGGQAVIEGVMMRGQKNMAVAVRAPGGEIVVHQEPLDAVIYKYPVMKLPFLRGLVALWDALGLGMKALMFSANVAGLEDGEVAQSPKTPANGAITPSEIRAPKAHEAQSFGAVAWTSIAVALAFMIGIFFVLPVLAAGLFEVVTGNGDGWLHNLIEGGIRIALFIGYLWAIGHMPDIKRVFGYHGAEHKTINAYEAGVELTPTNVQSFTLLNPRCGTTFLLIVLLMATLLFVIIGKLPFLLTLVSRIVLVPLVATVAYEFIRLMANMYGNPIIRAILAPGLALQKMTTRPPDLTMIEVGIAALNAVLVADGALRAKEETRVLTSEDHAPALTTTAAAHYEPTK